MNESQTFGFAKLVPGFDFLQNLTKAGGGGGAAMPSMAHWVAPTLNVEDLDKRIQELRAVHFWLEQNGKALAATIQALEVQKMTLSTLRGMNLNMAELAEALKLQPQGFGAGPAPGPAPAPAPSAAEAAAAPASGATKSAAASGSAQVDPMQWWTALSHQFQQIASTALQEVAQAGARPATAPAPATRSRSTGSPARAPAPARKAAAARPKRAASAPARRKPSAS